MNVNDAFPSNYLKASDLGDNQPVVTIDRVVIEEVGRDKDRKLVIYFAGKTKGFVLNKTNAKKITALLDSSDTDDWTGGKIRLYATETEFGGETVECIRVKAAGSTNGAGKVAKPKPTPKAAEPDPDMDLDDPVPF